jgi:hypothetical protein
VSEASRVQSKYRGQRGTKVPPHVPIKYFRLAANLSIDAVIARIHAETGRTYSRGSISAIENGHRGASSEILEAMELAYCLPLGSILTDYVPRAPRGRRMVDVEQMIPGQTACEAQRTPPGRDLAEVSDLEMSCQARRGHAVEPYQAPTASKALDRFGRAVTHSRH